ncbi:FTR1 family iron permease [Curtobacterium ammoniigenes]|uniref:FTR1 family iron permease n=1 Tax=Curtobacterium ammoniigenes TaxID=395387 RepID=UPI0014700C05|nr:FTR1 family protein [Curtobacterium ammoniigenes]
MPYSHRKVLFSVIPVLVIFLREGVEASLIIAILLAYLNRVGLRKHFADVFLGVGAALVLATVGGVIAYLTVREYDGSTAQTIFETITYLVAAGAMTYMTFWMRGHARGLSGELQSRADAAVSGGARLGLAVLAFQAVGREGLETVVFTLAIAFSTTGQSTLIGAAIGLAISLCIAFAIYRLGHRINLGRFFAVIGALLMVFGAGLLANAVQNMQELHWIPFGTQVLWNTGGVLSEDGTLGDIAHSFLGYAQSPTLLQTLVYVVYLALALVFFLRRRPAQAPARRTASAA